MKINWPTYFIYISLLFLLLALIKGNLIFIPDIIHPAYFLMSIFFLFAGFLCTPLPWRQVLAKSGYPVDLSNSLTSIGLTIFSKYIPGKIWTIIGPAGFIAQKYKYPIHSLTSFSLDNQLIILWTGLMASSFGLFFLNGLQQWGLLLLFLWLLLSVTIFTNVFHNLITKLTTSIFNRKINISRLSISRIVRIIPYFLLIWLLWCTGFYFLSQSLTLTTLPLITGLGFALASTFGILIVIAPGGIGVREGILAGYLILAGLDAKEATTISVVSRLWFLTGEFFIFFTAVAINKSSKCQ